MNLDQDPLLVVWRSPVYRRVAIGLLMSLGLLGFSLFGTVSVDFSCQRSSQGIVDCVLVRNTLLLQMSAVKISRPLAVDVVTYPDSRLSKRYGLELRMADKSYNLSLMQIPALRRKTACKAAKEVNDFLLRSNAQTFSKRFPTWQLETFGVSD